jgi:hypothetical protein
VESRRKPAVDSGHVVLGIFVVLLAAAACRVALIHSRRRAQEARAAEGYDGDRYFYASQPGVIFYTTGQTLLPDTDTCVLPNWGGIPHSK